MLIAEYSYEEDIRVKQEEASNDRKRCCSTKEFNHRRIPRKTERVSNHLMGVCQVKCVSFLLAVFVTADFI